VSIERDTTDLMAQFGTTDDATMWAQVQKRIREDLQTYVQRLSHGHYRRMEQITFATGCVRSLEWVLNLPAEINAPPPQPQEQEDDY
jgi:hypothetical protein